VLSMQIRRVYSTRCPCGPATTLPWVRVFVYSWAHLFGEPEL
jgi:hypothetical protein